MKPPVYKMTNRIFYEVSMINRFAGKSQLRETCPFISIFLGNLNRILMEIEKKGI